MVANWTGNDKFKKKRKTNNPVNEWPENKINQSTENNSNKGHHLKELNIIFIISYNTKRLQDKKKVKSNSQKSYECRIDH